MDLAILTLTYNRQDLLNKLFLSLKKQNNKDFVWYVVDDGSKDKTCEYMTQIAHLNDDFKIVFKSKTNGGKGSATNVGLDMISDEKYLIIIDDDEIIYEDAVDRIIEKFKKYDNGSIGGIDFQRDDMDGRKMCSFKIKGDVKASFFDRINNNMDMDGYTGYYTKALRGKRFPVFNDEKYIGPDVLQFLVDNEYELIISDVSIGTTEYLSGGLTRQGRKLRIKNPLGMLLHCLNYQSKKLKYKIRYKYSIMGYAYYFFSGQKKKDLKNRYALDISNFCFGSKIFGFVLYKIWKHKYL